MILRLNYSMLCDRRDKILGSRYGSTRFLFPLEYFNEVRQFGCLSIKVQL